MSFRPFLAAACLLLIPALSASPTLADKGHGHGKEKSHKERSYNDDTRAVVIINNDRDYIRSYLHDDYVRHCPPGLAKKHNGCQPPGQAKKRYLIGYPLPRDVVYVPVSGDLLHHLQPVPRGYQYVKVDQDVLLIAEASKKVIDAVTLLSAVGN